MRAEGGRDPRSEATEALAEALLAGDRRALARAITLVESQRRDHRLAAEALIARLMPETGKAIRVAISGAPGVGKSTFIEAFGLHLIARGHRLAVLAIDPSSPISGGSILGDRTRMEALSRDTRAFIRPSPSAGTLGGVARRTREAILLAEAAGFDVVVVETVGVGQSETAAAQMVDLFMLLLPPAGGDELQGIKKGIVELADLLVINKADGDLAPAARRAAAEYRAAMHLLRPAIPGWTPPVLTVSALGQAGIDRVWAEILRFREVVGPAALAARRATQARAWMWSEIQDGLIAQLADHPKVKASLARWEAEVAAGRASPSAAARALLEAFTGTP